MVVSIPFLFPALWICTLYVCSMSGIRGCLQVFRLNACLPNLQQASSSCSFYSAKVSSLPGTFHEWNAGRFCFFPLPSMDLQCFLRPAKMLIEMTILGWTKGPSSPVFSSVAINRCLGNSRESIYETSHKCFPSFQLFLEQRISWAGCSCCLLSNPL